MKLSNKIALLRKRQGWSQEELAEQLGISRQAVAKWESGQAVPALDKILVLSSLFDVSCDDLLKEDHDLSEQIFQVQEEPEHPGSSAARKTSSALAQAVKDQDSYDEYSERQQSGHGSKGRTNDRQETESLTWNEPAHGLAGSGKQYSANFEKTGFRKTAENSDWDPVSGYGCREIDFEEVQDYLRLEKKSIDRTSIGVALCIASPALLLFAGGLSEMNPGLISENAAGGLGIIVLLLMVAAAVGLFIWNDHLEEDWKFVKKGQFRLSAAARNLVEEEKRRFSKLHGMMIAAGVVLFILCAVPIFLGQLLDNSLLSAASISILLILVADGVFFMIQASYEETFDKLLKKKKKEED